MDAGIKVALSSDILPIGPMVGLYAATTRKGMSGEVYGPDEAITLQEALRGYTLTSAFINFDENIKGSLEAGKYADMIVLPGNFLATPADELMAVEVQQTYLQGELVYQRTAECQNTSRTIGDYPRETRLFNHWCRCRHRRQCGRKFAQEGFHAVLCRRSDEAGLKTMVNGINSAAAAHLGFC